MSGDQGPPICVFCRRLRPIGVDPLEAATCDAFPGGIPSAIRLSEADHRRPYEGDGGLLFDPADDAAVAYAAETFGDPGP
jgi:hypothetical protein